MCGMSGSGSDILVSHFIKALTDSQRRGCQLRSVLQRERELPHKAVVTLLYLTSASTNMASPQDLLFTISLWENVCGYDIVVPSAYHRLAVKTQGSSRAVSKSM